MSSDAIGDMLPRSVRSVRAATATHSVTGGQRSYFTEHDNLIVCLAGRYGLWLPRAGREERIELLSGDVLLRAAGTWAGLDPTEDYQSLGFIFTDRMVIAYSTRPVWRDGEVGRLERFDHPHREHLPKRLGRVWQGTCEALKAGADRPPDDPTLGHLARAVLEQVRDLLRDTPEMEHQPGKAAHTFDAVCEHIREHCHEDLTRESVAHALRITPRHVSRLFAEHGVHRFGDFLRSVRLDRAAMLLRDPAMTVAQVGHRCGFTSPALFSRNFKQRFGQPPGRWRESM